MASLQTGTSGIGTIIHEMLHQMGAIDLYPVHDEEFSILERARRLGHHGQWELERWRPMARHAHGCQCQLVRPQRVETLNLEWPDEAPMPCLGPTVALVGVTEEVQS